MSIVLKLLAIAVGIVLIYTVMKNMRKRKISAALSVLWILTGFLIIVLGAFPGILKWIGGLLGIWWSPSILVFGGLVMLAFVSFNHAREISVMRAQITELSEQVAVLKHELKSTGTIRNKGEKPTENRGKVL